MKTIQTILKLIIFAGIIIILGTAGASDLGRLSLLESISQGLLGTIFIFSGGAGLNLIKIIRPRHKRAKLHKRKTAIVRISSAA